MGSWIERGILTALLVVVIALVLHIKSLPSDTICESSESQVRNEKEKNQVIITANFYLEQIYLKCYYP